MSLVQNQSLTDEQQVILLPTLPTRELRAKFAEVFGEAARTHNRPYLIRRIAWRLQALASGGLSARARQRAAALANIADLRLSAPRVPLPVSPRPKPVRRPRTIRRPLPPPGSVLTRPYRGRMFEVKVLERGFEYDGGIYGSLSAVARAITGTRWNGRRFFGLSEEEASA
jgi:Protein of unknown function (DUF2924)